MPFSDAFSLNMRSVLCMLRRALWRRHVVGLASAGVFVSIAMSGPLDAQAHAVVFTPASPPLITAGIAEPRVSLAQSIAGSLRGCQAIFQDATLVDPDVGGDFSPAAVAAGRRCLRDLGNGATLPALEWTLLLRLAVAFQEDSIARGVVARQLVVAGSRARDRAAVLEAAVGVLVHNSSDRRHGNAEPADHLTEAHVALARAYAAQVDTMRPAPQVLTTRIRIFTELAQLDTTWNVDTALAREQQRVRMAQSIPLAAIPVEDLGEIRGVIASGIYRVAELAYFMHPTHENLTRFVATRDSLRGAGNGEPVDSLLGRPAPPLNGDYWFDMPQGGTPIVPVPGRVSLLVFGITDGDAVRLRQLHARYPELQIVVVVLTKGVFDGRDVHEHPERAAELIHQYLRNDLHVPGGICVIRTQYHTEPGLSAVPIASPMLDRYHLDPRDYEDHQLLIDAEGWVVQVHGVLAGHLIERLLNP